MLQRELISPKYLMSQKEMHARRRGYGDRGHLWTDTVIELMRRYRAVSVLDYGAGQGSLGRALREVGHLCREYDPAIPGIDGRPTFSDLVVATDVLEHIEPRKLGNVLGHIRALARKAVFLVVATRPAEKLLPNGKNAHLIIEDEVWWQERVQAAGFTLADPPWVFPDQMPGKAWIAVVTP